MPSSCSTQFRLVDNALSEFNSINREMERTGSFTVGRGDLFRRVARNNIMITEAIIVLGLLDRSDTAWTNDKYYGVWSMMASDYELSTRFQAMDKKVQIKWPSHCWRSYIMCLKYKMLAATALNEPYKL